MKKTYRNRLPKGFEVGNTNVCVENGDVVVEVELNKFEPKDGDFCVDHFGNIFILCEEGNVDRNHGRYALYYKEIEEWFFQRINITRAVRYATKEEKSAFLEALKKECNKRWDAEKKCLEDIRWTPNNGEKFYYIDVNGKVRACVCHGFMDFFDDFHNCFKTEQAAQKVADQIKEILKNSKDE